MTKPATNPPLSPRERLRWRRAMDHLLADEIFGRVVRDEAPLLAPLRLDEAVAASAMAPAPIRASTLAG